MRPAKRFSLLFPKNNLTEDRRFQKYTPEEVEYIKENYLTMSDRQIGTTIGRDKISIREKRNSLGLSRYRLFKGCTIQKADCLQEEIEAITHYLKTTRHSSVLKDIAINRLDFLIQKQNDTQPPNIEIHPTEDRE